MSDLFDRTLTALHLLQAPRTDPVSLAAWEEVREGLMAMRAEHEAARGVVEAARALVTALKVLEAVPDRVSPERLVQLADACTVAERRLAEALARGLVDAEPHLSLAAKARH